MEVIPTAWNEFDTGVINHLIVFLPETLTAVAEKHGHRIPIDQRFNAVIDFSENDGLARSTVSNQSNSR
jgi:hypothetical protein